MPGWSLLLLLLSVTAWQTAAVDDMAQESALVTGAGFAEDWPVVEMDLSAESEEQPAVKPALGESSKVSIKDASLETDAGFAEEWPVVELSGDSIGESARRESAQDRVNTQVANTFSGRPGGGSNNYTDFKQQGYPVVQGDRPGGGKVGFLPPGYSAKKTKKAAWAEYQAASKRLSIARSQHQGWREKRADTEATLASLKSVTPAQADAMGNATVPGPEPTAPSSSGIEPGQTTTDTIAHQPDLAESVESDLKWLHKQVEIKHHGNEDITLY